MSSFILSPILCDSVTREISTKTATAVHLSDKKQIAATIKTLSPLSSQIRHCKRVRTQDSKILCLINEEDKSKFNEEDICSVQIPKYPVFIRTQFEKAKLQWPVHFHPDARLEQLLAHKTPGIWDKVDVHSHYIFGRKEAALIVDPESNSVIAIGEDHTDIHHPLRHPTMNAVDQLSKKESDYLATGFDMYLKSEPCAMCAMALVHMRIKRVFFKSSNPNLGALKSKMKLHTLQGINHIFQVFQITECIDKVDSQNAA